MRYSKEHKARTRRKIIESAYRLFTSKGYAATSIDEIMRDCGLTRGGFYAYFRSKSRLYHEAINYAASQGELARIQSAKDDESSWIEAMLNEYLHAERAANNGGALRLVFFATDVANPESEVRSAYTNAFKSMSEKILSRTTAHLSFSEESILSMTAMIIGALAIARTTDDAALKAKLLASCKENAKALLEDKNPYVSPAFFWATTAGN